MIEAGAALQATARQVLGISLYEEQLLAGLALTRGGRRRNAYWRRQDICRCAAAMMQVLAGGQAHIATTNAYLARRDFDLLQPLFAGLGVSVGLLTDGASLEAKRAVYDCDVVYGAGYEFGFDFFT